jgi:GNAT superfamily N-acetyltransferase
MKIINLKGIPSALLQLAQWHHDEWGDYNPGLTLSQRIERMQPHLEDKPIPSTYVAVEEDTVLGSADIVIHDMTIHQELSPWLASVYVEAPQRNRGIGSALVGRVMQEAANAGYSKLYLFTPDRVSFYQRLGWHKFSEVNYCHHAVTIMYADIVL